MLFLFLVQNTLHYVFPQIVLPFLLSGVIFYALTEGPVFGAVIGCFAGFLLDILGTGKIGGSMAIFSLIGVFTGFSSTKIFYDSFFTQALLPMLSQYAVYVLNLFFIKTFTGVENADLAILKEAFFLSQPWFSILASLTVFSFLKKVSMPRHSRPIIWRNS